MTSIRETFLPDDGCVMVRVDLCLTGDTLIETLQGPKCLLGVEVGEKVLTFRDCRVAWGEVTAKKATGFNEIWRVTLDDGSTIEGTAEHRFMVVRHWGGRAKAKPKIVNIMLKNLKPKDRLVPLRKFNHQGYEILYSRSALEYSKTHQLVANAYLGERPEGHECHHIDGDKQNNKWTNLKYKEKRGHNSHHAKECFARVDQDKRVRRLRKALKKRDYNGSKNPMFGKLGKDNPNYGKTYPHRQNREKLICPVCKKEFEFKKSAKRIYCSKACFVAVQRGRNHKVLKIEKTDRKAQTYSITVEPDHNYALSCGVFVRNSQIEDRVCKMYCGTPRMVELANRKPWEYDAHTDNAAMIFGKPHDQITKDERYLGKKTTHGAQRGLRGERMSSEVSKETDGELYIHPKQCDKLLDSYLDQMWEIRDIYHPWVRQQVRDFGVLVNSWGRRLDLKHRRIDNDLYMEAYSFYMQSEAADWTNQYGFIPGHYYMMRKYGKPLNAQVHDEVIGSVPFWEAYDFADYIKMSLEQTREIPKGSGNGLCVPAEITVGRSWGDKQAIEFKQLPGRGEFYRVLRDGGFE